MKFSQKRTCSGCNVSRDDTCTVKKEPLHPDHELGFMMQDKPIEPCFKPKTNKDWSLWVSEYQDLQRIELKIYREAKL